MATHHDTGVSMSPQPPQDGRWATFVPASYKNMALGEAELPGGRAFREGTPLPEQQPPLAPVRPSLFRVWPGKDKCHPGPIISEKSPVLNQYRKRNRENIGICPPSCGEPLGEAADYKSPSSSSGSPWRIPIWREQRCKKSGCLGRKAVGEMCFCWEGGQRTWVRACVHAPFACPQSNHLPRPIPEMACVFSVSLLTAAIGISEKKSGLLLSSAVQAPAL
jgi:hypothetical protein